MNPGSSWVVHAPVGSASPTTGRFAARPVRSAKAIAINGVQILKSAQSADNPVPKSVPILKSFLAGRLDAATGRFLYYELDHVQDASNYHDHAHDAKVAQAKRLGGQVCVLTYDSNDTTNRRPGLPSRRFFFAPTDGARGTKRQRSTIL